MNFDEAMGRAIGARSATAGIKSQAELARLAGMSPNTLSRFKQVGGNTSTLAKIAEALGVHSEDLMGDARKIMNKDGGEK